MPIWMARSTATAAATESTSGNGTNGTSGNLAASAPAASSPAATAPTAPASSSDQRRQLGGERAGGNSTTDAQAPGGVGPVAEERAPGDTHQLCAPHTGGAPLCNLAASVPAATAPTATPRSDTETEIEAEIETQNEDQHPLPKRRCTCVLRTVLPQIRVSQKQNLTEGDVVDLTSPGLMRARESGFYDFPALISERDERRRQLQDRSLLG